jgi:hypothetical protein
VQGLQVQLILGLLADTMQIWPQNRLDDGLGVVVVVLLTLYEGAGVFGGNDPRLEPKLAQRPRHKVCAQARLHANDAAWQRCENIRQRKPMDLPPQDNLPPPSKPTR